MKKKYKILGCVLLTLLIFNPLTIFLALWTYSNWELDQIVTLLFREYSRNNEYLVEIYQNGEQHYYEAVNIKIICKTTELKEDLITNTEINFNNIFIKENMNYEVDWDEKTISVFSNSKKYYTELKFECN